MDWLYPCFFPGAATIPTQTWVLRSCLIPIPIIKGCSADLILLVKSPMVLWYLIPLFHRGFWGLACCWKPRRGWWSGLQETSGPIPGVCEVWELQWGCTFPKELLRCIFGKEGSWASSRSLELWGGDQSTAGQEQGEHLTTNNCSSLKCQVTVNGIWNKWWGGSAPICSWRGSENHRTTPSPFQTNVDFEILENTQVFWSVLIFLLQALIWWGFESLEVLVLPWKAKQGSGFPPRSAAFRGWKGGRAFSSGGLSSPKMAVRRDEWEKGKAGGSGELPSISKGCVVNSH